jgi:hypothetical protein
MNRRKPQLKKEHNKIAKSDKNQHVPMSELGKMEEGRDHDTGLYPMSCEAEAGLGRTDYRRNYENARLCRSEARSLKQEEVTQLGGW